MKIVLMGDSITDMERNRNTNGMYNSYGDGYAFFVEGELASVYPKQHTVYNRGIGGNRIVDIYSRIKVDCWNLEPDLVSVLIGINDLWHEIDLQNGVEVERYERFYRMYIEDTKKSLPNVQFMLLEPFALCGTATKEKWEQFCGIREYAAVVKKLAKEYGCVFVPLQEKFNALAEKDGGEHWLFDGVHPTVAGAKVIAEEWLKAFKANI